MNILKFTATAKPTTALLLKASLVSQNNTQELVNKYFMPLSRAYGGKVADLVVAIGTYHPATGKVKKADIKTTTAEILEHCDIEGITNLIVADTEYFKYLAGTTALERHIGDVLPCVVPEYEHIKVCPSINYFMLEMFPEKSHYLATSLVTAGQMMKGNLQKSKMFEFETYSMPTTVQELNVLLDEYMNLPLIACDIEATGLHLGRTEVLTIGFSKDVHNGFALPVHEHYLSEVPEALAMRDRVKEWMIERRNKEKDFRYIFHNGLYDVKHITRTWFMQSHDDIEGMRQGIDVLAYHDTMILKYLQLNSTVRPTLGLKPLSFDYFGDYAEDVKDAKSVPLSKLAKYNATDCCATFYIYEQCKDEIDTEPYQVIFDGSSKPLLKMMLNGMPINMSKVADLRKVLEDDLAKAYEDLSKSSYVRLAVKTAQVEAADKYNATHKTIRKSADDFDLTFNPASPKQLRTLLFDIMEFTPIDTTKTKQPKADRASIEEFLELADVEQKPTLQALVTISQSEIILNNFVKNFETLSLYHENTQDYTLHGSLVLGGTQCVTGDVLFNTDMGVLPVHKLKTGYTVITHTGGQNEIIDIFENGEKPIYEVSTKNGLVLTTSDNHPYFINGRWVRADNLKIGDVLTTLSTKEVWETVEEFPRYSVSSWGRVRNDETGYILTPHTDSLSKTNRLTITLSKPGGSRAADTKKDFRIHILVAKAFIGPRPKGAEVCHKNGLAWDNRVENLRYCTSKENSEDSKLHGTTAKRHLPTTKLTQADVDWLRSPDSLYLNNYKAAEVLGVSRELVRDVRNNKRWTSIKTFEGYTVEFMEDAVESIRVLDKQMTYGITVANDHSHVTNGIVTHNTGRLSSRDPNLQNLPSGSRWGKAVKDCFVAPEGWVFAGSDFNALESLSA